MFSMPDIAFCILALASKLNGFVTTPTVRIPCSLASFATTGAAPVPVPPPMPQVTNTMSAPLSDAVISSALSSAAFLPTSGFAPAPSPLVSFAPIWRSFGALQRCRACTSVFTPMNSTPLISSSTIRFTALFPAPPTPTTIILQAVSFSSVLISSTVVPPYELFSVLSLSLQLQSILHRAASDCRSGQGSDKKHRNLLRNTHSYTKFNIQSYPGIINK